MQQTQSDPLSSHYNEQLPDISARGVGAVDIAMGVLGVAVGIFVIPEAAAAAAAFEAIEAVGFIAGGFAQAALGLGEVVTGESAPSEVRSTLGIASSPVLVGPLAGLIGAGFAPKKAVEMLENVEAVVAVTGLKGNSRERLAGTKILVSQQLNKGLEENDNTCQPDERNASADKSRIESGKHDRTGSGNTSGNKYSSRSRLLE
jgi:hypothetical protein